MMGQEHEVVGQGHVVMGQGHEMVGCTNMHACRDGPQLI